MRLQSNVNEIGTKSLKRRKCFILLLSGDVQPNPSPLPNHTGPPDEFRARSGLGIININIRSMLPKLDLIEICVKFNNIDFLVLSEKCVSDEEISISRYVFHCIHPKNK